MQQVRIGNSFESRREAARKLLFARGASEDVVFLATELDHALLPGLIEPVQL